MLQRTIVITGASDGIGAAAARLLRREGQNVVVVGRSHSKTRAVASALGVEYYTADFADLTQVRQLGAQLLDNCGSIDVLVNNAGGIMKSHQKTVDGFERTFQVNHLSPFLLTRILLERLIESRGAVLLTSSNVNRGSRADFNDLQSVQNQNSLLAYASAKLANIIFATELHRRYFHVGISTAALHPGGVATNITANLESPVFDLIYKTPLRRMLLSTPDEGADQIVWLATTTPGVDWQSGKYYENRKVAKPHKDVDDMHLARRLWLASATMVGIDS